MKGCLNLVKLYSSHQRLVISNYVTAVTYCLELRMGSCVAAYKYLHPRAMFLMFYYNVKMLPLDFSIDLEESNYGSVTLLLLLLHTF